MSTSKFEGVGWMNVCAGCANNNAGVMQDIIIDYSVSMCKCKVYVQARTWSHHYCLCKLKISDSPTLRLDIQSNIMCVNNIISMNVKVSHFVLLGTNM